MPAATLRPGLRLSERVAFPGELPITARVVDIVNAPILRLAVGNFEQLGLRRAAKGPRQMVEEDGHVPLIDIGTLAKIRDGSIAVRGGIARSAE